MKLLLLHSSHLEFEPHKKAVDSAEECEEGKKRVEDCLVVFNALEEGDEKDLNYVIQRTEGEIRDVVEQVNAERIVIYPWVHLTSNPGNLDDAMKSQKLLEEKLEDDFGVTRAPFGWYKEFEIHVKGHPLSELSREIRPEEGDEGPAKEREGEEEFSKFIILDGEGNEYEVNKHNWHESDIVNEDTRNSENLKDLVRCEIGKGEEKGKPPHIEIMRDLELVDYCDVSDAGHFKWHPKGVLLKELILDYQDELVKEYGAFKIENPLIYRLNDERIDKLIGEFQEKIYNWEEDGEKLAMRPASDPGQFPYAQNLSISYKHLPLKQYEETSCFRKEQRGELSGLRRVRNFTMTDTHTFTADEQRAKEEFEELCDICKDLMNSIISKGDWILEWEGTTSYWKENKDWIKEVTRKMGKPAFIQLSEERSHYYSMKADFEAIHPSGIETQVSTVQMDLVNGERFDIAYTGEDNKEHPCTILHCSTFGSIERTLTFLLEDAVRSSKKNTTLPLWLSPTQVRIIPVSPEKHMEYSEELRKRLKEERIRVDIDDRNESVGRRIRRSESEWVPYTLVVGDDELEGDMLSVRKRESGRETGMGPQELVDEIKEKIKGYPFRPLPLPEKLSKRPKFVG
ncbi:MAG: threonine--tRNA ligase [Candidatus Aenigmatarchaeota archaeon]